MNKIVAANYKSKIGMVQIRYEDGEESSMNMYSFDAKFPNVELVPNQWVEVQ